MFGFLFLLIAFVCGVAILFGIPLGSLTPYLVGIAILALVGAILAGVSPPWRR